MKKLLFTVATLTFLNANAQVKVPQASAKAQIEQVIGLTEVEVEYARPLKKGRTIFGDVVPFDKIWRTGANENTLVSFSHDVQFSGKTLTKGKYSLYTKPAANGSWEVYFYTTTNNWGNPKEWNAQNIALTVMATAQTLAQTTEAFTIEVNPTNYTDGEIVIRWDNLRVAIPFHTFAVEQSKANIKHSLKRNDASMRDYYNAATFELNLGGDYKQGLKYINKAIDMKKDVPYYVKNVQAELLAKNGKKKEAAKVANEVLEEVRKMGGNARFEKELESSITQWRK